MDDAGSAELVLERSFAVPRARLFEMWTRAEHVARWWGPRGYTASHVQLDVRPGGAWRIGMTSSTGAPALWQGGVFREVVAPERLVFTLAWDAAHGGEGEAMLVVATFSERADGTLLRLAQSSISSLELREAHRAGWSDCFDRLAAALRHTRREPHASAT